MCYLPSYPLLRNKTLVFQEWCQAEPTLRSLKHRSVLLKHPTLAFSHMLSRVKRITSPGWMHETNARGWCTGNSQRDQVERELGGGIGMGNTCKSMADSCQCMQKPLRYCKIISLQLIKINGKKTQICLSESHAGTVLECLLRERKCSPNSSEGEIEHRVETYFLVP